MGAPAMTLIELVHVSKSYPAAEGRERLEVLRDVSLEVAAGESVAIIGPSGCGKSTMLNIIGALDTADQGTVRVDGRELDSLSDRQLAKLRNERIGFVFQQHHLLPQCTVLENVLVPTLASGADKRRGAAERARTLLKRVGLLPRLHHRPGQLSGGECQRVAVVRALINQPAVLLADEPTGALDHENAAKLVGLLVELNGEQQASLVMVTHAADLAAHMQRRLRLVSGALRDAAATDSTTSKAGP